jgi:spore maturation protein CgeB
VNFALFYHSVRSDWNHGNAHFLRGMVRALQARGHRVTVFEPADGWSREQLVKDQGPDALAEFAARFPDIRWRTYLPRRLDLEAALEGVQVVIAHEWTEPGVVAALGRYRRRHTGLRLLFHDTHHRMVSDVDAMAGMDLDGYDGVLAFGAVLADAYRRAGWGRDVHTWHEAADVTTFFPRSARVTQDVVWVGNWGDGEREQELMDYLVEPVRRVGARLAVHGVRYPETALAALRAVGADYRGWVPGHRVPDVFARARLTVHVPRRWYRDRLVGIPTIRMFEALACGIPLVAAPWHDVEGLFVAGEDYLLAENPRWMTKHLRRLLADPEERAWLGRRGLARILGHHTCVHRAAELLQILAHMDVAEPKERVSG